MKATKISKCVVCGVKVKETREFQPQLRLGEPVPEGIIMDMREQIIAWRDTPTLCAKDVLLYDVKKLPSKAEGKLK